MTQISALVSTIDGLLEPERFRDLGPNGLQVPPATDEVSKVVTGVSAQQELIDRAVDLGRSWCSSTTACSGTSSPTGLSPVLAERLRPLFVHGIGLAAYHLPLDAHPEVGNNAILCDELGCESHEAFGDFRGTPVGRAGTFAGDGVAAADLFTRVREVTGREPLVQGSGPDRIRRIGVVSGSAADVLDEAVAAGLDAFLTGEPREHVMADAREMGIHFIAAGHYATETFGVRALGGILADRFGIEHEFVDIPNSV